MKVQRSKARAKRQAGAIRPGLLDILTAALFLAVLLYAAWRQAPVFNDRFMAPPPSTPATAPKP